MRALLPVLAAALLLAGCGSGEDVRPLPEAVEGEIPAATTSETDAGEPPEPLETTEGEGEGEGGGEAGAGGQGDPESGAEVFAEAGCGTCHTIAEAGATGTIGPNLDETSPTFERTVEIVAEGSPPMPAFADQLTEEQIRDVAAFVVSATGG